MSNIDNVDNEFKKKQKLITVGDRAPAVRTLRKQHMEFKSVRQEMDREIREKDKDCPEGADAFAYKLLKEAYEIAMTSHKEGISTIFCSDCQRPFKIVCPKCDAPNTISVDAVGLLKAKVPVINKLIDKLAPNLQSTSVDIKVDIVFERLSSIIIEIVNNEIADITKRKKYLNTLEDTVGELLNTIDQQRFGTF